MGSISFFAYFFLFFFKDVLVDLQFFVDERLVGLAEVPRDDKFIKNEIGLPLSLFYFVEVEDEIELADVSEVLIQYLYKALHEFDDDEFIVFLVDNGDEVETGKSLVNYFEFLVVQKVAHLRVAGYHHLVHLSASSNKHFSTRCF